MKRVVVTVGPQYAGKSTFCNKIISARNDFALVNRDAILVELFGNTWLYPHSGGHEKGWERLWTMVESHLSNDPITIILDAWNGSKRARQEIAENLRGLGATIIESWYFVTPEEVCLKWCVQRGQIDFQERWEGMHLQERMNSYLDHYRNFHAQEIEKENIFDSVLRVNPLEELSIDICCQ
ncbi:MAG: AAA family ATPase [Patescibacteria group bacterium]|nr:AAA family ATPase [Patescibacteria group bacterium]MDE2015395.1 AAA family ATPase [Patescibacteria group bacterium]MDE2226990.1 AAA family ATPase [Patescibacteria group bacterium]